ncbi:MAG: hypothetical protein V1850_03975 [Candidatus Bathyarchaeota archaeon]
MRENISTVKGELSAYRDGVLNVLNQTRKDGTAAIKQATNAAALEVTDLKNRAK